MVQIKAYLPKEASGYTDALEYVESRFCDEYAGFTAYEARGGYQVNGNIIKEPVMVVEAYFTDDGSNVFRDDVNPLGKGLRDRMPNESDILVVCDGETYIY